MEAGSTTEAFDPSRLLGGPAENCHSEPPGEEFVPGCTLKNGSFASLRMTRLFWRFDFVRQRSSHHRYRHPDGRRVTVHLLAGATPSPEIHWKASLKSRPAGRGQTYVA
jgi:hypothetical protein